MPPPALQNLRDIRAALHHLLEVLRKQGGIAEPTSPTGHIADELHRYDEYAIVRCALDMGLRSCEIANLQLADIDWRAGTVTLKRTKSLRQDTLPLPELTGQALAEYVQRERPKTTNSAVFVRCLAPRDTPIGADGVRRVIRDAYQRIGLTHGRSHALRHTLACQLPDHGSSLKEVADVLRHRSLNTSLIYAKLDISRLGAVALPWPGSTK